MSVRLHERTLSSRFDKVLFGRGCFEMGSVLIMVSVSDLKSKE